MWDYSEKVLDHFLNPRNVGALDDADGVGEVGSMACGDALRLCFKLDADGRIADARFQTFGCGSAIASSSMLTEMLKGLTLEQAARISNEDIARELDGLPREKMHCSVMGREVPCGLLSQDVEICHCFQVSRETIVKTIRQYRLREIEDVTHYTKAGGGCTSCHHDIRHLIEEVWQELEAAPAGLVQVELPAADDERSRQIREVLENDIARALRTDGGDIELVAIRGRRVHVKLTGACASCPSSGATIKGWVEQQLREHVSPDLEVVEEKS